MPKGTLETSTEIRGRYIDFIKQPHTRFNNLYSKIFMSLIYKLNFEDWLFFSLRALTWIIRLQSANSIAMAIRSEFLNHYDFLTAAAMYNADYYIVRKNKNIPFLPQNECYILDHLLLYIVYSKRDVLLDCRPYGRWILQSVRVFHLNLQRWEWLSPVYTGEMQILCM